MPLCSLLLFCLPSQRLKLRTTRLVFLLLHHKHILQALLFVLSTLGNFLALLCRIPLLRGSQDIKFTQQDYHIYKHRNNQKLALTINVDNHPFCCLRLFYQSRRHG